MEGLYKESHVVPPVGAQHGERNQRAVRLEWWEGSQSDQPEVEGVE